jgi:hypothetical protein
MAIYTNIQKDAPIASVEFQPVAQGNFAFFGLKDDTQKEAIKNWLTASGQTLLGEAFINGKPVLITRGEKTQDELRNSLKETGNTFKLPEPEKKFQPWKVRGNLSIVGQILQLSSSYFKKGKIDGATATFAISNLTANATNIIFGASKEKDEHHLRYLKDKINEKLAAYLPEETALASPEQKMAEALKEPEAPKSFGQKIYGFMQRHSVTVGEIGLRYFGATAMVFPMANVGKAITRKGLTPEEEKLSAGQLAFNKKDTATASVGIAYLIGKTIALFSKVPDPYNPKPPSKLDLFREKIVFRLATIIEASAAGILAWDRLTSKDDDKKINFSKLNKNLTGSYKDYLGGIGGIIFAVAQAIRFFAPFGVKEVNMDELHAHITNGLAKVAKENPDKLQQAMAETSAFLTEHFKDKAPAYGKTYRTLTENLHRDYSIALENVTGNFSNLTDVSNNIINAIEGLESVERDKTPASSPKDLKSALTEEITAPRTNQSVNTNLIDEISKLEPTSPDKTFASDSFKKSKINPQPHYSERTEALAGQGAAI